MSTPKIYYLLFLFVNILYSNKNFDIYPILFSTYKSGGSDWHYENKFISIFGAGFGARSVLNDWSLETKYIQLGLLGNITNDLMSFSPHQGFPYIDGSKDAPGFWTEIATMKLSYQKNPIKFEFGKFDRKWGPGVRPVYISNKPPSYPQFGFEWEIKDNIKLIYFHGILKSNILDTNRANYYNNNIGTRSLNLTRTIAAHRLEWEPFNSIIIGLNESVIYGIRGIDFHYLLAVIPLYQIENYLGDTDNVQMGCDISYQLNSDLQLYIGFFMDELTPEWLFRDNNHNWFSWQFGINLKKIFSNSDVLILEYNWTDHRIYMHKFPINDYYSHSQPLGYWAGPHAEEFLLNYKYGFNDYQIDIILSNVKRGSLTQDMIYNKYHDIIDQRFSGDPGYEQKSILKFDIQKNLKIKGLSFRVGADWIQWKNAGFNIYSPTLNPVKNINKISANFSISYNFIFD